LIGSGKKMPFVQIDNAEERLSAKRISLQH